MPPRDDALVMISSIKYRELKEVNYSLQYENGILRRDLDKLEKFLYRSFGLTINDILEDGDIK